MICGNSIDSRAAVCLLNGLLLVTLLIPARAQDSRSKAGRGFGPAYDVAHESTLTGTIADVVTKPEAGGVGGLHLMVNGPQGIVDAHLGPFLTNEAKDALHAGTPVQIIGAPMQLHDKEYFLAREMNIGGRTVVIRSARGFFVSPHGDHVVNRKAAKGEQR